MKRLHKLCRLNVCSYLPMIYQYWVGTHCMNNWKTRVSANEPISTKLCTKHRSEGDSSEAFNFLKLFLSRLSFCPPLWNFNLDENFWTVSARALIFYINIPCNKTFPWVPLFFLPCDLDIGVWPIFLKTLTLLIPFEQWLLVFWYFI